jgi:hypothetical protein
MPPEPAPSEVTEHADKASRLCASAPERAGYGNKNRRFQVLHIATRNKSTAEGELGKMRKLFLPLVMMVCTLGVVFGQTDEVKQSQTAQTANNSVKDDCSAKDAKGSRQGTEGDPEAPQNTVEYGGGG